MGRQRSFALELNESKLSGVAALDMDALGDQLRTSKEAMLAEYKAGGLPRPELATLTATRTRI